MNSLKLIVKIVFTGTIYFAVPAALRAADVRTQEQVRSLMATYEKTPRYYVTIDLASSGEPDAIEFLRSKFTSPSSSITAVQRADIAAALIVTGHGDDSYFQYLVEQSSRVAQAPSSYVIGLAGRAAPNDHFTVWSKRNPDFGPPHEASILVPWVVRNLAALGDPRAAGPLRRALQSQNSAVAMYALYGLAKLDDDSAVNDAIAACKRASKNDKAVVCAPLIYFSNHKTRDYAKKVMPEPMYSTAIKMTRKEAFETWLGK